ncbi:MAG: hypothetical protein K6T63_05135 [Alicyclobacillus herbarius]|uniref:hypothetical protein n=1 Tax=Alicyclobacillus herbarius TaxID=122960 RepID=UPI00042997E8|nr:hypothetical protein [Alicyclobacillus herbarius]MCL6632000.1 hypothetical protein [Alicyclobacillus herbarius]
MQSLLWDLLMLLLLAGLGWFYVRQHRRAKKMDRPLGGAGWMAGLLDPRGMSRAGLDPAPQTSREVAPSLDAEEEVEQLEKVLGEIYDDVTKQLLEMRRYVEQQMDELRAEVLAYVQTGEAAGGSMPAQVSRTSDGESSRCGEPTLGGEPAWCDEATAYRVLDLLYAGCSDEEAALRLGVTPEAIAQVRQLLLAPAVGPTN